MTVLTADNLRAMTDQARQGVFHNQQVLARFQEALLDAARKGYTEVTLADEPNLPTPNIRAAFPGVTFDRIPARYETYMITNREETINEPAKIRFSW